MSDSATPDTTPAKRKRPPRQEKPFADFPLFWHVAGYWCVKRDGRQIPYTADWRESLNRFNADETARAAGQLPARATPRTSTVRDAINVFLSRQSERLAEKAISEVQFGKYRKEAEAFGGSMGLTLRLHRMAGDEGPALFRKARAAALARGLDVAKRHILYVRKMLELAHRRGLMPPPNYGEQFDPPTAEQRARRRMDEDQVERAWSVDELRAIITHAPLYDASLLAEVLLGLNCAFGSDDCALLRDGMVKRDSRMIRTYRSKTLRKRIAPLWVWTLSELDSARARRCAPADAADADRVFLSPKGKPVAYRRVHKDSDGRVRRTSRNDSIKISFNRLLRDLGLKRHRTGFYTLRAMFRTMAVGAGVDKDLIAVIKGQQFERPIDEYYLRGDLRAKLFQVTDHVFDQLLSGWACQWPQVTPTAGLPSDWSAVPGLVVVQPKRRGRKPSPGRRASRA